MFKRGKLTTNLMSLSVAPLLLFGILVMIISSSIIYTSLKDEVKYSLDVLVHSSYRTFELTHPGKYAASENSLLKDGVDIKEYLASLDEIKRQFDTDVTIFYGEYRYLTTILKEDGTRAEGTKAAAEVVQKVLVEEQDYFSDDVLVNGTKYFGYYMPLRDAQQEVVGMLFAGKTRAKVMIEIARNIKLVCFLAGFIMLIGITVSFFYSRKTISSLNKTKKFLGEIARGNLQVEMDEEVLQNKDEIGEMGRFAVVLQASIVDLVGKDPLTSLLNRRSCDIVLQNQIESTMIKQSVFTIAMGDIDFFKQINDMYGHQAGDETLRILSHMLQEHMDHLGFVFRWGGEEFLLVYEGMEQAEAYTHVAKLQTAIAAKQIHWKGKTIRLTMTFGLCDSTQSKDIDTLIQLADANLYMGKREGRNCIMYTETFRP